MDRLPVHASLIIPVGRLDDSIVHSLDGEHWQEASPHGELYGLRGVTWAGAGSWLSATR